MIDLNKLIEIVAESTGADVSSFTEDTNSSEIDGWDSLGHLQILSMLRDHFGEDYEEDPDLASAVSIKEIFDILNR